MTPTSSNLCIWRMKKSPYRRATLVSAMWIMSCLRHSSHDFIRKIAKEKEFHQLSQIWQDCAATGLNCTSSSGRLIYKCMQYEEHTNPIYVKVHFRSRLELSFQPTGALGPHQVFHLVLNRPRRNVSLHQSSQIKWFFFLVKILANLT